jgi:hypothetical protein
METLVPDDDRRCELEAEMPHIPLRYFESRFEVPRGWCDIEISFLLLSEPYRADARRARELGWPTIERMGNHLDVATDPEGIARRIVDLADR